MKKIGIVAWNTGTNSFGATIPYLNFFSKFGIVDLIMPNEIETRELDLLVVPGGPDVDTKRYLAPEEAVSYFTGKPCPFRERFDAVLLPKYIAKGTPIFGICRGHQTLAVHFGGRLIQDLSENGHLHNYNPESDRTKLVHSVTNSAPGLLRELGIDVPAVFDVNSIHHQAVSDENLPAIATVLARFTANKKYPEDRLIEAITYEPHYPIYSVQWHPEEIKDSFSVQIINKLLNN